MWRELAAWHVDKLLSSEYRFMNWFLDWKLAHRRLVIISIKISSVLPKKRNIFIVSYYYHWCPPVQCVTPTHLTRMFSQFDQSEILKKKKTRTNQFASIAQFQRYFSIDTSPITWGHLYIIARVEVPAFGNQRKSNGSIADAFSKSSNYVQQLSYKWKFKKHSSMNAGSFPCCHCWEHPTSIERSIAH